MRDDWRLGATYMGEGRSGFLVWAPRAERVEVRIVAPRARLVPMERLEHGYHAATVEDAAPGTLYLYRLDARTERPDPAARFQPAGVHGPSQVVEPRAFPWEDRGWLGLRLEETVLYELHVGTYTSEGTFDAVIPHLDELKALGVTALELMPVAQFPGGRNWGYDGVHPYAVQDSYGGPEGLRRLVNACHLRGLAVVLDVVYNHLGPEGNYLWDFGPYFTANYRTPWGDAVNFDGPDSDEVRRFYLENALHWLTDFHLDALRLDAIHAIRDFSAQPFLEELAAAVHQEAVRQERPLYVIAESDLNDARVIRSPSVGGYGLDAQWSDDFHHALHALLTGERSGYYQDFGRVEDLARALRAGFVYAGQYSPYRRRRHGNAPSLNAARQFVVCAQNHDQVGNRMLGERLAQLVDFESLKLAAGTVLLSPFVPLVFMGEEYGETAPFQYFVSHGDPELVESVRRGRREEFAAFGWAGEVPDPQDEATFLRSKLDHALAQQDHHRVLRTFYAELLRLRRETPALAHLSTADLEVVPYPEKKLLLLRRWTEGQEARVLFNFGDAEASVNLPTSGRSWRKELDSAERQWRGPGSAVPRDLDPNKTAQLTLPPHAFVLFVSDDGRNSELTPHPTLT